MDNSLLLIVLLVVAYILFKSYNHFRFWQRQGLPSHTFPTLEWVFMPFHDFLKINANRYGKIYGAYNFGSKILIINDPNIARELSIKEIHKFPIRSTFYFGSTNINKSLFFMDATEDWKRVRSIVTPAFTSGKLKGMLHPIQRIVKNFIFHMEKYSETGELFDIKKFTSGFTMDVIASCAYGINVDSVSQPDHPIVSNAKKILNVDASLSFMVCVMLPSLAKFLNLHAFNKKSVDYFDNLTFEIIEKRIRSSQKQQTHDLIGLMMESNNGEETNDKLKGISKEEISGQGILFFIAGFDTTNATFAHILYYLTKYPEWQDNLYEELSKIETEIDYDVLRDLPILNAVVNETLRLKPPLVVFQRAALEDCTLLNTGIKVPRNTLISIQPYIIHRNPEYFPDPEEFKPERFVDNHAEKHFAFMPFGAGSRLCVGMRFAQNELRIGLAKFILTYRLLPNPDLKLEYFRGSVLLSPKNVMVQIEKR